MQILGLLVMRFDVVVVEVEKYLLFSDWLWPYCVLGLGRQFGEIKFGSFGVLSVDLSAPLSMFSINQPLFLQNTKPLYPNLKYLF